MNRDSEHIQKRILMLLRDLFPSASLKDVEAASRALGDEPLEQAASNDMNPIDCLSVDSSASTKSSESSRSFRKESVFELGDVPAVQDRFHALIKNRLQSEIQHNPPLFPWESELQDYGTDPAQEVESIPLHAPTPTGAVNPAWVWLKQLKTLNLPVRLPEPVLVNLLQQCQEAMQTPLREGAKLVRAVEELFPGQDQALNYLAGLVMTSPARSGSTMARATTDVNFPTNYEAAVPAQQMVLSLLAAQEIISNLTLTVSVHQPIVERHWETEAGPLSLQVTYQDQQSTVSVRVRASLPCGGTLQLTDGDAQSSTRRSHAGYLSGELFDLKPGQAYSVEVSLGEQNQSPLTFTIQIV